MMDEIVLQATEQIIKEDFVEIIYFYYKNFIIKCYSKGLVVLIKL